MRGEGYRIAIGSASKNARTVVECLRLGELVDASADGHSTHGPVFFPF
jgi:hypothetical protein